MVPFISEVVQEERQYHLEASDIRQCELHILKILDWRLHCKTHLHFLDMQKSQGVVSAGDRIDGLSVAERARSKLIKYNYFFADMVLLDADLCYFAKTLSCAAIIATARLCHNQRVTETLLSCESSSPCWELDTQEPGARPTFSVLVLAWFSAAKKSRTRARALRL